MNLVGNGSIPISGWPGIPYWQGREPSRFDPNNVAVRDGILYLKSTALIGDMASVANPEKDIWVAAACVSSLGPSGGYGYYEARIKASALSMTSSFWLQGRFSEIDIVEQIGRPAKQPERGNLMLMNTHYFKGGWKQDRATPRQWRMPSGAADAWHVYGVWWKGPDEMVFYHDGVKVAEVEPGGAFTETMYLFFDTEIFTWEGLPDLESLNDPRRNTMQVDWVRVWREVCLKQTCPEPVMGVQ